MTLADHLAKTGNTRVLVVSTYKIFDTTPQEFATLEANFAISRDSKLGLVLASTTSKSIYTMYLQAVIPASPGSDHWEPGFRVIS